MRDYSRVSPQFWIGETGRRIRSLGSEAIAVAFYVMTCPTSNMIGLYYLSLPTICHETGLSEKGASKALRSLFEAQFCEYDGASEVIWVYEMARFQIADQLDPRDKRCKGLWRELLAYKNTLFFKRFYERYQQAFCLPHVDFPPDDKSPFEAPSKPLRSQDQDQDQDQEGCGKVRTLSAATAKGAAVWEAYAAAYEIRYGVVPVRNAKTNALLCQLVDRLGAEEAPQVARFYLAHNKPFYVSARHPANLLVQDAEGLRTQWATGVKATTREAQSAEQTDNVREQYNRVMASMATKDAVHG